MEQFSGRALNKAAHEASKRFLYRHGYDILDENWHLNDKNKIDLVCKDDGVLVFVEVLAKQNEMPHESQAKTHRAKMERIALGYLGAHSDCAECPVRFDVMSVSAVSPEKAFLRHHINAFGLGE